LILVERSSVPPAKPDITLHEGASENSIERLTHRPLTISSATQKLLCSAPVTTSRAEHTPRETDRFQTPITSHLVAQLKMAQGLMRDSPMVNHNHAALIRRMRFSTLFSIKNISSFPHRRVIFKPHLLMHWNYFFPVNQLVAP
jgi:hypothetical protein